MWQFGKDVRKGIASKSLSPGPGAYKTNVLAFDIEKPRFHVGVKTKDPKPTTVVPGAGTYNPKNNFTKKELPSYSMKIKLGSSLASSTTYVPGPGNYNMHMGNKRASPQFGFGSSTRETGMKRKLDVPGPGAYRLNSTVGNVAAHAMPNRTDEQKYV